LIADATGASAVLEHLDGEFQVLTGDQIAPSAITNTAYRKAMSQLPMDRAFGGDADMASRNDSYGRFARIAAMIRDYDPADSGSTEDYAFQILASVSGDDTRRSVVYDAGRRRVAWLTPGNAKRRWIDFESLDLTLDTPTQLVDIERGGPGDVSGLLEDFTKGRNRSIAEGVLGRFRKDSSVVEILESRGLTVDDAIERIVQNPKDPGARKREKP
jgi:hypothetical protein